MPDIKTTVDPNALVAIQFIKRFSIYQPGQIAGFPQAQAQQLVDDKRASFYKPEPATKLPARSGVRAVKK